MTPTEFDALLDSGAYRDAAQRVVRQLLEALLFEGALPDVAWSGDVLSIAGTREGEDGAPLVYRCRARRTVSFGRIRIVSPVRRICGSQESDADDVARVVAELGAQLGADPLRLAQFSAELLATHIKDAQTRAAQAGHLLREAGYDAIEAGLTGAHPYHPGYKSRMGFTLDDNRRYAPECASGVTPLLLAARRDRCRWSASRDVGQGEPRHLLSASEQAAFDARLAQLGLDPADYLPLPVHPWQWEALVETAYHTAFARRELVPIGMLSERYAPQQSIRTLANTGRRDAPSLKLAMSLVNTSTSRVLAPHTVRNAALMSDWLADLAERTDWPAPLARPVFLKEIAGVGYVPQTPVAGQYGALACIWRESVHRHLRAGEAALPVTAITHVDADGRPLVADWVARHGVQAWVRRLVERVWLPVLHMLWRNGTALESHAQNMVLLHVDGLPERVALKDFHDGVRYSRRWLRVAPPALEGPPAEHARVNPNSFIETDDADELRDFTGDALFFVNLAEIAWFFACHFGLDEAAFWEIAAGAIRDYQANCPDLADSFARFDCFAPTMQIELLASRRFLPEIRLRTRAANNPLAQMEYA
ncbi:IucA/IucC family siderophore biosynthesis protein (plasmid) [Ralstonia solanacearum]|uniref:IucA/IucC family siderophore biosynthesis protein n=2 Tax=Ralstonia solanacearum species complex TaxID=3116862 RepID=A0A0S4UYQ2_RALSL|nr:IucA/IucC family siderophore biosynthesis protein [Ralstonia pseudosolanacearum]APC66159.1 IucA/IucC family siderophore biosynthesis protein [Ralstonia solanacearum OE1-1]AUS44599.1 IucA/IucC family siderophore biosynthesis protein [Ralstonia solanacearum]API76996.1 siderophore biosynthesis protein [Ralstonia pseudosolanacearum]ASL75636.1 siderophore biosynthesis protein [Ralstonia pseudosolanacearum]AYA48680.1 IucA/IucC family siderophore biosynthesis protein [Ralstonia pseudosolanacearum]